MSLGCGRNLEFSLGNTKFEVRVRRPSDSTVLESRQIWREVAWGQSHLHHLPALLPWASYPRISYPRIRKITFKLLPRIRKINNWASFGSDWL